MALDGTVISCMAWELNHALAGGKINKIAQPEKDELMLTIKNSRKQYRLLVSASASLPLVYLTDQNKTGPMTAPNFCMLLRKHIGSGRILRIWQPGMERILNMEIEHLNELGDICRKLLIIELMGKHSNIIFCQEDGMILDPSNMSPHRSAPCVKSFRGGCILSRKRNISTIHRRSQKKNFSAVSARSRCRSQRRSIQL